MPNGQIITQRSVLRGHPQPLLEVAEAAKPQK
jgi:hypothetical protein